MKLIEFLNYIDDRIYVEIYQVKDLIFEGYINSIGAEILEKNISTIYPSKKGYSLIFEINVY